MDRTDPEANAELDEQQKQQQQQHAEQNEVKHTLKTSPSKETTKLSTSIVAAASKSPRNKLVSPKKVTSMSSDSDEKENVENIVKSANESDTESESRLIIQSETETNDKDSAENNEQIGAIEHVVKENGGSGTSMSMMTSNKRKRENDDNEDDDDDDDDDDYDDGDSADDIDEADAILSDEEDFAGFDAKDKNEPVFLPLMKKLKKEHINNTEIPQKSSYRSPRRAPIKNEQQIKPEIVDDIQSDITLIESRRPASARRSNVATTPITATATSSSSHEKEKPAHFITRDPRYRNPFKFGWKRELVFRANLENKQKVDNKGEVYYHTPNGKKLRTKAEILGFLRKDQNLDIGDFTFAKESIGMPPDQEIVRSAKIQTPSQRNKSTVLVDTISPDTPTAGGLGLGKRVPKPKMPKGASPPPAANSLKSRLSNVGIKQRQPEPEIIQQKPAKNNSKSKGEPCTIQCVLAMGTIPQLQCKKCLCLYHHECVGLEKFEGPIANYICESCLLELADTQKQQISATGTVPPHSSSDVTNTVVTTDSQANISVGNLEPPTTTKQRDRSSRKSSTTSTAQTSNGNRTQNTIPHNIGGSKRNSKEENSISMTTRLPNTTNITQSKKLFGNDKETNSSPPQSVAIVAGRKYIMVPKTNTMSISPAGGDTINGSRGTGSLTFNDMTNSSRSITPVATKPLTTGEDTTPQAKKRRLSRTGSIKSSGANVTSPNAVIQQSSVHTLFASEFFNNISKGYDILLHIFQYLKVQELQRASCVCRMWNHVANNSILWKTVRMKNSQVNNWSALMSALQRHGTQHLDLRKVLISPTLNWSDFLQHIGDVSNLESIDLCKCPAEVVTGLFETNSNLRILNAVSIIGTNINLSTAHKLQQLTELRLKAISTIGIENLTALKKLTKLRHLSLTSINGLESNNFDTIGSLVTLESLELGDCINLTSPFARNVLVKLKHLERLRLEKGQERCCTFEILDALNRLPKMAQLELVNFDIKSGFDTRIAQCKNLRRILLIPTYISQSATTNNMILSGISKLADTLQTFTWVVTQELLRVTELYVDQCDKINQERRPTEDKIPILKPVPLLSKDTLVSDQNAVLEAPQVEILPLHTVESMIKSAIPNMKLNILKVPFHGTWRQTMSETQ